MVVISMAHNKIFMKRGFLNYLIFSGILFTNIINPNNSIALTQENIDIPKVVSYRSASCGCCKKWINLLRDNGLEVVDNIVEDLSVITNSDINSINDAIKDLKNKYSNPNSAIELNAVNNSFSLELKSSLNEFVDDLLPSDLKTSELRTLAIIAIRKKILQSDLILLRGSGAYAQIKELLE